MILDTYAANAKLQIKLLFIHCLGKNKSLALGAPYLLPVFTLYSPLHSRLSPLLPGVFLVIEVISEVRVSHFLSYEFNKNTILSPKIFLLWVVSLYFVALPFLFPVIPAGSVSSFVITRNLWP